ncbi:hypothetical protein [Cystobacter ferrugineus]|uniref:hypothetical protein n=1 Tax=Cystobacter ferrugineus TaxID=83449 RepID=UPI0011614F0F|nr:hypothetical protein [Cystobacter ferrugineus]
MTRLVVAPRLQLLRLETEGLLVVTQGLLGRAPGLMGHGPPDAVAGVVGSALDVQGLKPASSTKYNCASTNTGVSHGCSWTNPTVGTWFLATDWTSGSYDVKAIFE